MLRTVQLKIRLDQNQTLAPLTADGWKQVGTPVVNVPPVETVERGFDTDADFVKAMVAVEKGSFTVLEATLKDLDLTFYQFEEPGGGKLGSPESLLDAVVRILAEVLSGGESGPHEPAVTPKPPGAATPPAPQELMTGVPKIPPLVWRTIRKADGEAAAKTLIEKATAFETDRKERAAWSPTRENALMAHLKDDVKRAGLAERLLEEAGGITAEHIQARKTSGSYQWERVRMLRAAVGVTDEITVQLKQWTVLSNQVVPLLKATTAASAVLILVCLALVFSGRLNGTEMAVLAFVFTLAAVSPATLLLVGRPLKGLDQWSPDGARTDEAAPKTVEAPAKPDAGGKPGAGKSTETPK